MKNKANELRFLISGAALSGNKGAMAMAQVTIRQLKQMYPGCEIGLLSKYPSQDRGACKAMDIMLVPAAPDKLVTMTVLRALLICMFRKWLPVNWLYDSILRAYRDADLVLDVGGITFSDDRDWRGRALSVGWLLSAVATGTPMIKLSQAIGPFRRWSTRFFAKRLLRHCPALVTRGRGSEENVRRLLPDKVEVYRHDDVAFLLEPAAEEAVDAYLKEHQFPMQGYIGITPSAVIDRKARQRGIHLDYHKALIGLVEHICQKYRLPVVMIPHAWPQSGKGREDMELCVELYDAMNRPSDVFVVQDDLDCRMLKGLIAKSDVFIACRFHSMIAAVSSRVPTMVIGWGHKYNEIMEQFNLLRFSVDFTQTDVSRLCSDFDELFDQRQQHKAVINEKLPEILNSAQQNYQRVREYVDRTVVQ